METEKENVNVFIRQQNTAMIRELKKQHNEELKAARAKAAKAGESLKAAIAAQHQIEKLTSELKIAKRKYRENYKLAKAYYEPPALKQLGLTPPPATAKKMKAEKIETEIIAAINESDSIHSFEQGY